MPFYFRAVIIVLLPWAAAWTADLPRFEVASIKRSNSAIPNLWIFPSSGGRVRIVSASLKDLIKVAWDLQPQQIASGPEWISAERFEIQALPEAPAFNPKSVDPDLLPRIQSLVAERFHLTFHREMQQLPVLALVAVNRDGSFGSKLIESATCEQVDVSKPPPFSEPTRISQLPCGVVIMGTESWTASGITLDKLAALFTPQLGHMAVNKTGSAAKYSFRIELTSAEGQDGVGKAIQMMNALSDLGLKFESRTEPVEVFVVDHAEMPSEN